MRNPFRALGSASREEWDQNETLRKLIRDDVDLRRFYATLGYDPGFEGKTKRLLGDLKKLLRSDVRDWKTLMQALESKRAFAESWRTEHRRDPSYSSLLVALLAAQGDHQKILSALNEPDQNFDRDWGTEGDVSKCVQKRPTDPERFNAVLTEIESRFDRYCEGELDCRLRIRWIQQASDILARFQEDLDGNNARLAGLSQVQRAVLAEIASIRRGLMDEQTSIDLYLLECAIEDASFSIADDGETRRRKRRLDNVLGSVLYTSHTYDCGSDNFSEGIREQAAAYMRTAAIHHPWVTKYLLRHLLDASLAKHIATRRQGRVPRWILLAGLTAIASLATVNGSWTALGVLLFASVVVAVLVPVPAWSRRTQALEAARAEVNSGGYDGEEIARRLRRYAPRGEPIPSITFGLLRLHDALLLSRGNVSVEPPTEWEDEALRGFSLRVLHGSETPPWPKDKMSAQSGALLRRRFRIWLNAPTDITSNEARSYSDATTYSNQYLYDWATKYETESGTQAAVLEHDGTRRPLTREEARQIAADMRAELVRRAVA